MRINIFIIVSGQDFVDIAPLTIVVTEFRNATFFCSFSEGIPVVDIEKQAPGSAVFTPISTADPRLVTFGGILELVFTNVYLNVTQEDNGTVFRCVSGGLQSEEAVLIVEEVRPGKYTLLCWNSNCSFYGVVAHLL